MGPPLLLRLPRFVTPLPLNPRFPGAGAPKKFKKIIVQHCMLAWAVAVPNDAQLAHATASPTDVIVKDS